MPYKIPGPLTSCILQESTDDARTSDGGVPVTWGAVVTFDGGIEVLSASERLAFAKQTVTSTHWLFVSYDEIGDDYAADLKEENRIYIANTENALAAETYEITGVSPWRDWKNTIGHWEILLRKIE